MPRTSRKHWVADGIAWLVLFIAGIIIGRLLIFVDNLQNNWDYSEAARRWLQSGAPLPNFVFSWSGTPVLDALYPAHSTHFAPIFALAAAGICLFAAGRAAAGSSRTVRWTAVVFGVLSMIGALVHINRVRAYEHYYADAFQKLNAALPEAPELRLRLAEQFRSTYECHGRFAELVGETIRSTGKTFDGFATPPGHIHFRAKKLFGREKGILANGAIAYLAPQGGGPEKPHTHPHDHLFLVISGEARILLDGKTVLLKRNQAFRVRGTIPHAIWNNASTETVMIALTLVPEK